MLRSYRQYIRKEGIIDQGILDELAKAIRRRHCALLIGLGLVEIDEDLPQRDQKEFLRRMVQWCVENKLITQKEDDDFKKTLDKESLEAGELEKVERKIKEEYIIDANQRRRCMTEILLQNPADIRYIYHLLASMSFRAYFTSGYDDFLERASEQVDTSLSKYDKASIEDALGYYQTEEQPFILNLYGDGAKDTTEVTTLGNRFVKSQLPEPIFYPQQLRELLLDVHTLFVGFETTDADFQGLKSAVNKKDELKRWLLIPESHIDEEKAKELWIDDKITTLSYTDLSELKLFLRKLFELAATPQQVEVYISYAQEDKEIQERLQQHLCVMDYPGVEIAWSDGKIGAGQERKQVIEERLQIAQVMLLLVSVDYLSSIKKSNIKIEMTRAVQRHHRGEARVIPIIVKSCPWKYAPFANLEVLPLNGSPIDLAPNTDQILLEVAEAIKVAIEEWVEKH